MYFNEFPTVQDSSYGEAVRECVIESRLHGGGADEG